MGSDKLQTHSTVLRPLVMRWLPGWISAARRRADSDSLQDTRERFAENNSSVVQNNVHLLCRNDTEQDHADRLVILQEQDAALVADYAKWEERCQSLEICLDRSRDQLHQAESRLTSMDELVPAESADGLSLLQESYRNFAMTVALQEHKLVQAEQRVATIQQQRAALVAEVLALSTDPRTESSSGMTHVQLVDDFKNAA